MTKSFMNITISHVQRQVPVTIISAAGKLDASTYLDLVSKAREIHDTGERNILLEGFYQISRDS